MTIRNTTEYTVSGEVQYAGGFFCSNDRYAVGPRGTWQASSRGVCLVTGITGALSGVPASLQGTGQTSFGEKRDVVSYDTGGTSYSQFLVSAYGGAYRVFSEQEFANVTDTRRDKSPGFYLVNETAWPVAYSFDQVGCLHHGIVPTGSPGAGGAMRIDTGAVWFTLRVHIQPDGQNPQSDLDCVKPVAELVGDVAMAAFSGGSSAVAKAGGKLVIKTIAKEVIKAGIEKAGKKIASRLVKEIAREELGKLLTESGSIAMYGQYAGYAWPFRCDRMPEYRITGGPEIVRDENGDNYIADGEPFTVTKVNDCGNDMMLASRLTMSADKSFFGAYDTSAGTQGLRAGTISRWKVGDEVEVLRLTDNRWVPSGVVAFDARSGILIRYRDSAQQAWVVETAIRARQSGSAGAGGAAPFYRAQLLLTLDAQNSYWTTSDNRIVRTTPQNQAEFVGQVVASQDGRFASVLQFSYGLLLGIDTRGFIWSSSPMGQVYQIGSVRLLDTSSAQATPAYTAQVLLSDDPQNTYWLTSDNRIVQFTPQQQAVVVGWAAASRDSRFAYELQYANGSVSGVDGWSTIWSLNPTTGLWFRVGSVSALLR